MTAVPNEASGYAKTGSQGILPDIDQQSGPATPINWLRSQLSYIVVDGEICTSFDILFRCLGF